MRIDEIQQSRGYQCVFTKGWMSPSQAIPSLASPTSKIFTKVVMPGKINKDSRKTQRFAANWPRFRPRIPDYRRRIAPKSFLNTVDNSFKSPIARNGLDESADTVLNRHKKTKIEPFNPLPTLNKTTLPVFDGLLKISFNAFPPLRPKHGQGEFSSNEF